MGSRRTLHGSSIDDRCARKAYARNTNDRVSTSRLSETKTDWSTSIWRPSGSQSPVDRQFTRASECEREAKEGAKPLPQAFDRAFASERSERYKRSMYARNTNDRRHPWRRAESAGKPSCRAGRTRPAGTLVPDVACLGSPHRHRTRLPGLLGRGLGHALVDSPRPR